MLVVLILDNLKLVVVFGTTVSWKAKLQKFVALSTTEAEYLAVAEDVKEALWFKGMPGELGYRQKACKDML